MKVEITTVISIVLPIFSGLLFVIWYSIKKHIRSIEYLERRVEEAELRQAELHKEVHHNKELFEKDIKHSMLLNSQRLESVGTEIKEIKTLIQKLRL